MAVRIRLLRSALGLAKGSTPLVHETTARAMVSRKQATYWTKPAPPAPPAPFDVDVTSKDAVQAHLSELGIDFDGRWGLERLVELIP